MTNNIDYYYRTLLEGNKPTHLIDPYDIFKNTEPKRKVISDNPFKISDKDIFQILGIVDKRIVGTVLLMPNMLSIKGKLYNSLIGHGLSVEPECRGKGIGSKLTDNRLDFSKTHSLLICAASQMQLPILKRLGSHIFLLPRMILLKRSYSVIENKIGPKSAKLLAPIVDLFLKLLQYSIKQGRKKLINRGFKEVVNEEIPIEVETIIAADKSDFKEVHNCQWFKWVRDNSLVDDQTLKKEFVMVYMEDKAVGFYMTKKRFYERASHRGYKNISMGSVMEWGTIAPDIISDNEICLLAISSFSNNVDAIELCCANEEMANWFKKKRLVRIGESNLVVRYRPDSVLASANGIDNPANWRLRPAMGDNGLS